MKRSGPLKRTKPLPRSTKPMARSRLPRMSATQRKRIAEAKPVRDALKEKYPWCWVCGSRKNLTVHEIAKGSHRTKALDQSYALLVACWDCNSGPLEDAAKWPLAKQLACLMRVAPTNYDILAFNRLRGRRDTAIEQSEVDHWRESVA